MSQQISEIQVMENRQDVLGLLDKEDKESIVWWNPVTDCIVKGSQFIDNREHPSDNVILNLGKHFVAKKEYLAGKRNYENFVVAGYSPEYESSAYDFQDMLKQSRLKNKNLLDAAMIRPEHFKALQTTAVNELIISIENRQHNLLQTVTQINSDKLNQKKILEITDGQTRLVTRNIGEEGLPSDINPFKWKDYSIGLQLNGTKIFFSGTMNLTAFDIDVMSPFVQIMEGAILNDKQKMIADLLNATIAGYVSEPEPQDWDTLDANGRPSFKPWDKIGTRKTVINNTKRGTATWIASQLGPYETYLDIAALWGQNATGPITQSTYEDSNFVSSNVPRVAGLRWAVDDWIDADNVIIYSSKAIYFNQGPRRSSNIVNNITGNFGTINLEYYLAKMMFPDMIKRMTAVTT